MNKISLLVLLTLMISLIGSCSKDDTPSTIDCTGNAPTYTNTVKAIMDNNCALSGCHTTQTQQSGFILDTYNGTFAAAGGSNFLCSITWSGSCERMPQGGLKLSDANITSITCWIQNGRPQ